jgi:hypothetical protein
MGTYTLMAGDASNQAFSGQMNVNTGRFFVPVVSTLPAPQKAGHTVLVPSSGLLCVYNGVNWYTYGPGVTSISTASGFFPDDQLVGAGLVWWGEPSGLQVDVGVVSGVDTWINRAGTSSTDLVSAGDSNNPFIASGAVNGFHSLYFDGNPRWLQGADSFGTNGTDEDFTVFIVAKSTVISGGGDSTMLSLCSSTDADTNHHFAFRDLPTAGFRSFRRSDAGAADNVDFRVASIHDNNWNIWCIAFSGTAISLFKNGLQVATSGMNVGAMTTNLATVGALALLGAENNYFVGFIPEIIAYSSGIGPEAHSGIHKYLAAKYNIALAVNY